MGCDAFADDNGEFEIIIYRHGGKGEMLGRLVIGELEDNEPLDIRYVKGRER